MKKRSPEEISTSAREKILAQLNSAQSNIDYPLLSDFTDEGDFVFPQPDNLLQTFCDELEEIKGNVIVAGNEEEALKKLKELLSQRNINSLYCTDEYLLKNLNKSLHTESQPNKFEDMEAAITRCEVLVARSGTAVVSSAFSGRRLNVFPPIHIIWAEKKQLVPFISDAINRLKEKYGNDFPSQVTFVTGQSRTADIEKTLVMGAHGPRELIVIINQE
jgi:L-lactate dehydrogenase complex protein LldG